MTIPDAASPRQNGRHVLLLVQNNAVPVDRRVWNEVTALRRGGYAVTVICPQGVRSDDADPYERRDGVEIHRFAQRSAGGGALGYVVEYLAALRSVRRLVRRLARQQHFDVVHVCNPPDLLLLCALPLRRGGTRLIFDHHDLAPELYRVRLNRGKDALYRLSLLAERLAFRTADVVIATNGSYRRVAIERGGVRPADVFVVRSAPDITRFAPVTPELALKRGREHLLVFIGEIAPQDGIDHALRALALLRAQREDWHAVFAGDGPALADMLALCSKMELDANVEFPGWLEDLDLRTLLSTADVCLVPDPWTPLGDKSTLVKVAEYLAMSRPVVAFDLTESKVTAGEAALYARSGDHQSFASAISQLLDDPVRRCRMGALGRARIEEGLSWEHSARELLRVYDYVLR